MTDDLIDREALLEKFAGHWGVEAGEVLTAIMQAPSVVSDEARALELACEDLRKAGSTSGTAATYLLLAHDIAEDEAAAKEGKGHDYSLGLPSM